MSMLSRDTGNARAGPLVIDLTKMHHSRTLCSYVSTKESHRPVLQDRVLGCTFAICKHPGCFPILHVHKAYFEALFLMFLVSMLRIGCYVKQMKSQGRIRGGRTGRLPPPPPPLNVFQIRFFITIFIQGLKIYNIVIKKSVPNISIVLEIYVYYDNNLNRIWNKFKFYINPRPHLRHP